MNTATIPQLKNEIKHLDKEELMELCLKLAKFKKENKELLSYLLFDADDEVHFIEIIKKDITIEFDGINCSSSYLIKKSSRRILKEVKKYVRYSKKVETEIELLMHFCRELGLFESALIENVVLANMYRTQVGVVKKCIAKVHEDLQYDYGEAFEKLIKHKAYTSY